MKCENCKRSSSITIKCSCNKEYCTKCRLPETHGCEQLKIKKQKDTTLLENKTTGSKVEII